MSSSMNGRSLLSLQQFSSEEIRYLLELAADLKEAKAVGAEQAQLSGKNIALIFEKSSTRTRVGFEVAAYDQGAHVTYLGPSGTHLGVKETAKDTARVLGRLYDGIEYRGYSQETVEELAEFAGVPVFNGLTDEFHPTQVLADFLTMREQSNKPLGSISFCFMGDASNNIADSLLVGGAITGMDVRLCAPRTLWPEKSIADYAKSVASKSGARITITEDIESAVNGCDFIYTDVWVSMGQPESTWRSRIELLKNYQVTMDTLDKACNPNVKFMHCLPAFHNDLTTVGAKIKSQFDLDCMEVTDAVFESDASVVFDQAENRMHTIKAILVAFLAI